MCRQPQQADHRSKTVVHKSVCVAVAVQAGCTQGFRSEGGWPASTCRLFVCARQEAGKPLLLCRSKRVWCVRLSRVHARVTPCTCSRVCARATPSICSRVRARRDIKLENILMGADGNMKIIDVGRTGAGAWFAAHACTGGPWQRCVADSTSLPTYLLACLPACLPACCAGCQPGAVQKGPCLVPMRQAQQLPAAAAAARCVGCEG